MVHFFTVNPSIRVTIPKTVEVICKSAFHNCGGNRDGKDFGGGYGESVRFVFLGNVLIKDVELPSSLKKIKNYTRSGACAADGFLKAMRPVTVRVVTPKDIENIVSRNQIPYGL